MLWTEAIEHKFECLNGKYPFVGAFEACREKDLIMVSISNAYQLSVFETKFDSSLIFNLSHFMNLLSYRFIHTVPHLKVFISGCWNLIGQERESTFTLCHAL